MTFMSGSKLDTLLTDYLLLLTVDEDGQPILGGSNPWRHIWLGSLACPSTSSLSTFVLAQFNQY